MKNDPEHDADFQRLITEQLLDPSEFFRDLPDDFDYDEPPLYARYDQLAFLDALPTPEKHAVLLRAAARHLRTLLDHAPDQNFYCMLSIQTWDEWEDGGWPDPRFFNTFLDRRPDPADPRNVLDYLHFDPPSSPHSTFVAEALTHDPTLMINENTGHTPRIYVRPTLYWSTPYQTYR